MNKNYLLEFLGGLITHTYYKIGVDIFLNYIVDIETLKVELAHSNYVTKSDVQKG